MRTKKLVPSLKSNPKLLRHFFERRLLNLLLNQQREIRRTIGSFIMSRKFGSDPIMLKSRCLGYFWADKTRKSEIFGFLGPSQAKMPFFGPDFEKFLKKSIFLVKE